MNKIEVLSEKERLVYVLQYITEIDKEKETGRYKQTKKEKKSKKGKWKKKIERKREDEASEEGTTWYQFR